MKNSLVKNTLILIISSLVVRVLSLFNRIIVTRLLGNDGISLYVITLPSIMLFMSIAGFSLNIALSKVFSENLVTKKYSERQIFKASIAIGLTASSITTIILLLTLKPLVFVGLKQEDAFYPILSCILFLPLVALNNIFRGYYNGINKINISAYANLIEQISRIIVGTVFLYIFLPYGLIVSVTMAIISMGIGESISLIYSIIRLKQNRPSTIKTTLKPTKEILSVAVPTTFSRLVGNLTSFLEPIIYTLALTMIGFSSKDILYKYSAVTAYALPLITLCSFVSQSIATAIIPNISKSYAAGNISEVNFYIKKSCLLSIIPGILVTIMITSYGGEYMKLVYNSEIGVNYVKNLGVWFIVYYISAPLFAIMQALGKAKFLFKFSTVTSILKLGLIFGLTFVPWISYNSLIVAILINTIFTTLTVFFYLKNEFKFHFHTNDIVNIVILTVSTFFSLIIIKAGNQSYLLNTLFMIILFLIYTKILKVTRLNDK